MLLWLQVSKRWLFLFSFENNLELCVWWQKESGILGFWYSVLSAHFPTYLSSHLKANSHPSQVEVLKERWKKGSVDRIRRRPNVKTRPKLLRTGKCKSWGLCWKSSEKMIRPRISTCYSTMTVISHQIDDMKFELNICNQCWLGPVHYILGYKDFFWMKNTIRWWHNNDV